MNTKKRPWQTRQGDVFLAAIDPPKDLGAEVPREGGAVVLALGESSGHRHQIAKGAKLFARGAERFLHVSAKGGATVRVTSDKGAPLAEERHEPVKLPPGTYKVTIQREWSLDQEVRRVQD